VGLICHRCGYVPESGGSEQSTCPHDALHLVEAAEHDRDPEDVLLGTTVGGKYAVVGFLGCGGMSAVYRAVQQPIGREVALKLILPVASADRAQREHLRQRFLREAQSVASLDHPNTVTLHDFGIEDDGALYMVLELIRGSPLHEAVAPGQALPPERAVRVACGVLAALGDAHLRGIVHRDLKPSNIMLTRDAWGAERLKVLDFGIAKVLGTEGEATVERLTHTGVIFGTPQYMAPEQVDGGQIAPATDLYALGVILYELLAGRLPFESTSAFDILTAQRTATPPPFDVALALPPPLVAAVLQAMEKEPGRRFPSALAMAHTLCDAVGLPRPASSVFPMPTIASPDPGSPTERHHSRPQFDAIVTDETLPAEDIAEAQAALRQSTPSAPTYLDPAPAGPVAPSTQQELAGEMVDPADPTSGKQSWRWLAMAALLAAVVLGGTLLASMLRSPGDPAPTDAPETSGAGRLASPVPVAAPPPPVPDAATPVAEATPAGDEPPDGGAVPDAAEAAAEPLVSPATEPPVERKKRRRRGKRSKRSKATRALEIPEL